MGADRGSNMIRFSGTAIRLLIIAVAMGAGVLPGQFLVTTQGEGTIDEIRNGGSLVLESPGIGERVTALLSVTYQGPLYSTGEILEPVIEGSTKFSITTGPDLPLTLDPDAGLSFLVSFVPDGVGPFSARLTITLNQQLFGGRDPAPFSFLINLSGVVADYTISYQLPGGNQLLLDQDGVIGFEDTEIEASQAATVTVTNRGSGPGSVESVVVNGGSVFQASGLQLLPVDVLATRDIRFNLIFEPQQVGTFEGTANINFGFGSHQIRFMGRGVAATFTYDLIQNGQTTSVAEGATITLPPTSIGDEVKAQLRVTNVGTIEGVIGRIALQGTGFRLEDVPVTPATIDINESFTLSISFTPADLDDSTGSLVIGDASFTIIGQGSGPELKYSFTSAAGTTDLEPRDTIVFPETDFGQTSQVGFTVNNTGTEAQTITLIGASGNFSAADLPTLPMSLPPGQMLTFNVVFEPLASGILSGNLSIDSTTFSLSGLGGGGAATFTYDLIQNGQTTSVAEGGTITLPPTSIGDEVKAQLRVTNVGTIEGVIGRIALQGTGFRLEDVPVTPATIDINESFTLSISFTPADLDDSTGSLVIGDASFTIIGQGSGPELKYSFTSAAGTTDLEPRDTIVFPETDFGQTSQVGFTVNNTGTEAQTITLIGASGNFSAADLPTLPMSLPPGQMLTFNVVFEPLASGILSGNLSIDSTTFSLSGLGGEPGQVPGPTISGAGGAVNAVDQVSTGVSIAEPYPVDVAGTLTIAFESDAFSNDPTIQFSTGGRTAPFTIRAGQTQARFANNRDAIRFQTGTVTGTIILSSTFQIEETRQDITPDRPPELTYTLSTQAPQLLGATIGQINAGTVQVLVTGFSTARTVNTLRLSLTGAAGSNLTTSQLDIDARNAFRTWYQSNQSSGFGSQFTATVTLRVDGEVGDITAVSVQAVNELGNSNSVTADLPVI